MYFLCMNFKFMLRNKINEVKTNFTHAFNIPIDLICGKRHHVSKNSNFV